MPITIKDAPEVLPAQAKRIYVAAWNSAYKDTCKERSDRDECASKIAWSAVKQKFKKSGDTWIPKAEIEGFTSFSMHITKAVYNREHQELRWHCTASDTDDDNYTDNMSLELFSDFLERIEAQEKPRNEKYCSEFWAGGMPYLSIAHYSDQDGKAVPGEIESIYVDGKQLKGKGTFFQSKLGWACFNAINQDKHGVTKAHDDENLNNPVRISIGFLDYMHRHKSNGEIFERTSPQDICPWCVLESLTGTGEGKEYLKGLLIHLALTRVPVNKRTDMEVLSMTTREDDAKSIVGEEAEPIEKNETTFRSETDLVTRAKDEDYPEDESEEDDEEEKKKKKKAQEEETKAEHALDKAYGVYRAAFDQVQLTDGDPEARWNLVQPFLENFVEVTRSEIVGEVTEEQKILPEIVELRSEVAQLKEELRIAIQALKDSSNVQKSEEIPAQRSISPAQTLVPTQLTETKAMDVRSITRRSVGLTE